MTALSTLPHPLPVDHPALVAHGERVQHELACLDVAAPDTPGWPIARQHPEGHVYDAIVIGGGQSGLGAAFGLRLQRVTNVLVLDDSPAGREGPWLTYARMITLRTPKQLTAIDFGIPGLTFRAWWEAQHGSAGWAAIDKIPRQHWMAYLAWYRAVLALPVRNGARVELVEPLPDVGLHRIHLADEVLLARKVILATGIQGGGEWHVPPLIAEKVPRRFYSHTADAIDYAALAGKRIGILGGGASAFDNAQFALGVGVAEAHVFLRRAELPRINPIRFMEGAGVIPRFPALNDAEKYASMAGFFRHNQPPTTDTFNRSAAYPGFHLHLGSPWLDAEVQGDEIAVTTPHGVFHFDHLVLSTGLVTDPALRPELRLVADGIACWRDRYTPPADIANPVLDAHPYLGSGFQFTPRRPEDAAALHGLFAFNYSALISLGLSASAISGLRHALPRLALAVADELFLDDREPLLRALADYAEPEFFGSWSRPARQENAA